MAGTATDKDLKSFVPDILGNGITTFADDLTKGWRDILNKIKVEYWPPRSVTVFNEGNLNKAELESLQCYRALGWYILPKLSERLSDDDPDVYALKAQHFKDMFEQEWILVQQLAIYDFDEDSSFEESERQAYKPLTIGRG